MTMHLAAFYESVDPAGVLTQLNAVVDQAIFTSGVDVRVPQGMANLVAAAGLSAATGPDYGQVQSPSLRQLANQAVLPIAAAAKFASPFQINWFGRSPRMLAQSESVNFALKATGGAAAANYGLIWLADGQVQETSGKMFSVHATAAASLVAGTWVNGALTFDDTLPAGNYSVVGLRAQSANLIAARLVFVGGAFRPGVIGDTSEATALMPYARYGGMGTFGSFNVDQPPTIDFLGATDTAQDVILDLIKTG